jgi:hypothetical protein
VCACMHAIDWHRIYRLLRGNPHLVFDSCENRGGGAVCRRNVVGGLRAVTFLFGVCSRVLGEQYTAYNVPYSCILLQQARFKYVPRDVTFRNWARCVWVGQAYRIVATKLRWWLCCEVSHGLPNSVQADVGFVSQIRRRHRVCKRVRGVLLLVTHM